MGKWQKIIDSPGGFAMCGSYVSDKLYLGTYGTGNIYSFLPLVEELKNSGEAVLSMCEFKGQIYATSENNDMTGQRTRVLRRTGVGWVEAGSIKGYSTYFMTVLWGDYLVLSATTDLKSIDYWYSQDGTTFKHGYHFNDWLWVPTVYNSELYFIGHGGSAGGPGTSMAMKWNGSRWVSIPSLCGTYGVTEWQCAAEHNGNLYLGSGGWTLARGSSTSCVYKFDGNTCVPVKHDTKFHEVQALLSSKIHGYLFASFGHGFKSDEGGSQLWASLDGINWIDAGVFDCPQLYTIIDSPYGLITAGGKQGNLEAFFYDTRTIPEPQPEHTCPKCGHRF